MLLRFSDDTFVEDFLKSQLGLETLLNLIYEVDDLEIKKVDLAGVQQRAFEMPIMETLRVSGVRERITPSSERIKIDQSRPRSGRLAWVEVFLQVLLSVQVHDQSAPIQSITATTLVEEFGEVTSMTDLKAKLAARYPQSVVDALFKQLRINTVEDFQEAGRLFFKFLYQTPPPFDPNDPTSFRDFKINVCVQFQSELNVSGALQNAKLSRSILENERDFMPTFDGGDIITPYAFVVIFPDSVVVDNAIPGLKAADIKAGIQAIFKAENMIAAFAT